MIQKKAETRTEKTTKPNWRTYECGTTGCEVSEHGGTQELSKSNLRDEGSSEQAQDQKEWQQTRRVE